MSAVEETKTEPRVHPAAPLAGASSLVTRLLNLLSSVRFGVTLLMLLVAASMIGMLIVQQNVDGFDKYYAGLTPAQKLLYGSLGFFDIYHSWYFNVLLLVLSLNIVLASIDRFPGAWQYVRRPKLDVVAAWLKRQPVNAALELAGDDRRTVAERVAAACKAVGLKPRVTEKGGKTVVFAERGAWNRLGAYAVHVALLTIFLGGFLTAQFGHGGQMPLKPGQTSDEISETIFNLDQLGRVSVKLPFEVTCTDIEQKLIRKDGPITADNTIDWLTRIKIKDETGEREALVHMNNPYDYRGYRFFQQSFVPVGRARRVTVRLTPEDGRPPFDVSIARDGSARLPDGGRLKLVSFQPDFTLAGGQATTASGDYNNPAAVLDVVKPDGAQSRAYAFAQELPSGAPVGRAVAGYKFRLVDFEKVPEAHTLAIQRDPGATIFYVGSGLLGLTLAGVFFFSHQRVWAIVEERGANSFEVILGGNANRNAVGLEDRFKRLIGVINGQPREVQE